MQIRSKKPVFKEAVIACFGDYEVIKQVYAYDFAGFPNPLRQLNVLPARICISGRVIMRAYQACRPIDDRVGKYFTGVDDSAVERTDGYHPALQ